MSGSFVLVATSEATGVKSVNRVKPSVGLPPGWWPIALKSEVAQHPQAFRLGSRDLAVYRDLQGVVRAVDDSCPHRRLPLSMGRITEDGHLQCAYHGWCFDGATGVCTKIPNLHEGEKIPGAIRINVFATAENLADVFGFGLRTNRLAPAVGPPTGDEPQDGGTTMFEASLADGLVLVWTGDDSPTGQVAPSSRTGGGSRTFSGRIEVRAPYDRVAEAILLNPGRALALGPLFGAGEELAAPEVVEDDGTVVVRRERLRFDLPRPHTFDPLVKSTALTEVRMVPGTGLAWLRSEEARAIVGLTPIGPYRTIVRWRGEADGAAYVAGRLLSAALSRTGRTTARAEFVADDVEGLPDAGLDRLRDLRARHSERVITPEPEEGA
ncbi:MAG: rieske [2Fe-2S] domain protein [Conexibacter sp.]|nr:rieske [2Fe-2S] domain protein [Conexibacter sp.]